MSKAISENAMSVAKEMVSAKMGELTPVQKLGAVGAVSGAVVGGAIGGAVGAAGGFLWQHKGKVAIAAVAAVAFAYREEISNFASGVISGESAGGDAFM
jgi:hypothetical protein